MKQKKYKKSDMNINQWLSFPDIPELLIMIRSDHSIYEELVSTCQISSNKLLPLKALQMTDKF